MLSATEKVINEYVSGEFRRYSEVTLNLTGSLNKAEIRLLQKCTPDRRIIPVTVNLTAGSLSLASSNQLPEGASLLAYYCSARGHFPSLINRDIARVQFKGSFSKDDVADILSLSKAHQKREEMAAQKVPMAEAVALGLAGVVLGFADGARRAFTLDYPD